MLTLTPTLTLTCSSQQAVWTNATWRKNRVQKETADTAASTTTMAKRHSKDMRSETRRNIRRTRLWMRSSQHTSVGSRLAVREGNRLEWTGRAVVQSNAKRRRRGGDIALLPLAEQEAMALRSLQSAEV